MAFTPRWFHDPITERQQKAIRIIRKWLGHKFHGNCKGQAISFIGSYYDEAKRMRDLGGIQSVTNKEMAGVLEVTGPWD